MREAYAVTGRMTKSAAIQNGCSISVSDTISSIHEQITEIFQRAQPLKTWALIAETLGLKEHAAKHRAANHRDYSVEELQILLQGDGGAEVLELLMAEATPKWWVALHASLKLSQARVAQAEWQQTILSLDNAPLDPPTRRKLKKVHNADRAINAVRAAKELATGFLHQNVSRPLAGAVAEARGKAEGGKVGARR